MTIDLHFGALPGDKMWDRSFFKEHLASAIQEDKRPGEPGNLFWWTGDGDQVATYWYTYQSRWIPLERIAGAQSATFAGVLFDASRHWSVELHFNKGQSGASAEALQRDHETSMNPAVYDAAALAIVAASGTAYPGVRGHEPNVSEGEAAKADVTAAMAILRAATPGSGSYLNETEWFESDWQRSFWGENYDKLLRIKRRVDPAGLFVCHHCVGSESTGTARYSHPEAAK